jgi:hypothetical protein
LHLENTLQFVQINLWRIFFYIGDGYPLGCNAMWWQEFTDTAEVLTASIIRTITALMMEAVSASEVSVNY